MTERAARSNIKGNDAFWQQGQLVEVAIADLSDSGEGVGRLEQRVVFVPDTVPGDRILARLIRVKPQYARGKMHQLIVASPDRVRPNCIVADKCGGCQWQAVRYEQQLAAKQNQVIQALERIGGLSHPPVSPILAAPFPLDYRNKVTYPLAVSASGQIQVGYYQKGSHRLVNLNQCPVQDPNFNPFLVGVKQTIQQQGWTVYDEKRHQGQLRHLSLRIGRRTGEILLTLVVTDWQLPGIADQAAAWLAQYPQLVGVLLNCNPGRTNAIFGPETRCIAGQPYLRETFAGLQFQIGADTFFQVYTEQAETLLQSILTELQLQGTEQVVDAYCGVGTLTLPLAQHAGQVIGLERQAEAVAQARINAELNQLTNVRFQVDQVEDGLSRLSARPDIVVLDPPRKGCDRATLDSLLLLQPQRLVYISCKPATLARDLKLLIQGGYHLTKVQPADFFPQTAHVEAAAFLEWRTGNGERGMGNRE